MTNKQHILIMFAYGHERKITTAQANDLMKDWYYCNHAHYVSMMLKRMVRNGTLKRTGRGRYQLLTIKNKPEPENTEQMKLL